MNHAYVERDDGKKESVKEVVADEKYLKEEYISTIQNRGAAIIAARKLSSAMSAAKAAVNIYGSSFNYISNI